MNFCILAPMYKHKSFAANFLNYGLEKKLKRKEQGLMRTKVNDFSGMKIYAGKLDRVIHIPTAYPENHFPEKNYTEKTCFNLRIHGGSHFHTIVETTTFLDSYHTTNLKATAQKMKLRAIISNLKATPRKGE